MNAEKYVKDIGSRIKCSSAKRKEIETQLLSDISMRMDQGETLTEIMESMGTAQEIAGAFTNDLPEAERKGYRRRKIGFILGAIVAVVLVAGMYLWWIVPKPYAIEDSDLFSQEALDAQVETVITLLDQNDFETLQAISVDDLHSLLTQEVIDQARDMISDDWGERRKIGSTYAQGIRQRSKIFVVTQTDAMYENASAVYTITFDENLKMAGVYMR